MLARHDGRVVLVAGAIPGERVTVRIGKSSKQVAFGTTVDVLEASPWRREPICDPACGGSAYAHIVTSHQRALKAEVIADTFRRIGKRPLEQPVTVAESPETAYRLRARLHVRNRRAGFFLEQSHRICDASRTGQVSADALDAVGRLLDMLGERADDCETLWLAENVGATERVCHIEPREGKRLDRAPEEWVLPQGLTGLTTRVGERLVALTGNGRVTDSARELCGDGDLVPEGVSWTRKAVSFFQGNRYLTGHLLRRVLAHVGHDRVLDLYAGVGLFSVALAARGATVVAVEGDSASVGDLEINAGAAGGRLTIRQASVEAVVATAAAGTVDAVVLDPPRTGASPEAIAGIVAIAPARVAYVSCDPATLARDAALLRTGGYQLVSIEAFDMFPNTPHIETLAIFDRASASA